MHTGENLLSFFSGAAIVHVPLSITPMNIADPYVEIGLFLAKSVIGGAVSVLVAHLVHIKKKDTDEQGN